MKQIPFERPSIGAGEIQAITKVLKSGWLTMGPETQAFEDEFAKYVGAKYAISVNSATSGLFLSLKALGIRKGDEVIVPSFTFASTANVVIHCGATPVFVDIQDDDYTMDQKSFDKAITKRTKAVIPVHYAANRAHIKTDLPIIEDSAHLIGKNKDNNKAFTSCYSFYATKNMTTGEGGMITTSDSKIADWLKMARLHGLSRDAWKRYGLKSKWVYTVEFPGWKFNTTDLNSAIGRVQLKRLDGFEKRRRHVVALYNKHLGLNNKGTHLYPILVENREKFFDFMKENGIGCSFNFTPLHLQPAYKKYNKNKLPVTEFVGSRVSTIPLDAVISDTDVKFVAKLINQFKCL
jgi:dTDP-4-amino-4,6-dideoxygalactose transaminase